MTDPIRIRSGWDVVSGRDGCTLFFAGEVVDAFPSLDGAANGRRWAREANAQLASCLAGAPTRGGQQ